MAQTQNPILIPTIVKILDDEKNPSTRVITIDALENMGGESVEVAIIDVLPSDTCLDSFTTSTLGRVGSLKIIPQLWNIQIKSKYKTYFCDAIAKIQQRHQLYNPEL